MFDFDETLKICGEVKPKCVAPGAQAVIDECKSRGYPIAIATASMEYNFVVDFLREFYPDFGNDYFLFESGCFQHGQGRKEWSLQNIANCFGLPKTPASFRCFALFDDNEANLAATDATGAIFVKVDPTTGTDMGDFAVAEAGWTAQCAV